MNPLVAAQISTVFGIGRAPRAPGTVASLAAIPFAWLISLYAGPYVLAAAATLVFLVGVWASGAYATHIGREDPGECVIDEVAGQWFACALAPLSIAGFVLAFLLFRAFDITKMWPVSRAEELPGGLGICADDAIAGLIAGIIVTIFYRAGLI